MKPSKPAFSSPLFPLSPGGIGMSEECTITQVSQCSKVTPLSLGSIGTSEECKIPQVSKCSKGTSPSHHSAESLRNGHSSSVQVSCAALPPKDFRLVPCPV